jgi:hypothetical protein
VSNLELTCDLDSGPLVVEQVFALHILLAKEHDSSTTLRVSCTNACDALSTPKLLAQQDR